MEALPRYAVLAADNLPIREVVTIVGETDRGTVVRFGDGRLDRPVAPRCLKEVQIYTIGRCYYNEFVSHPGTWADIDDPGLKAGDPVMFVMQDPPNSRFASFMATVTEVSRLHGEDPWLWTGGVLKSLAGWWLIRYDGWFAPCEAPTPAVYSDVT